MRTSRTPVASGGVSIEEVNMDSAIAAHEALKAGKDPYKAVNPWVRKKGKKAAPVQQQEREPATTYREYFTAVANLARGNFKRLSMRELVAISAVANVPVVGFEDFSEVMESLSGKD